MTVDQIMDKVGQLAANMGIDAGVSAAIIVVVLFIFFRGLQNQSR